MGEARDIRAERSKAGWIGDYRLGECLGEGGMGVVYRATREGDREPIALKLVRDVDEGLLATFRREIYALETMDHPGVVRIVDHGVDGGRPWYAMELLAGQPLNRCIDTWRDSTEAHARRREAEAKTARSDEVSQVLPTSERPTRALLGPADDTLRPGSSAPPPSTRPPPAWAGECDPEVLTEILRVVAALCEPLAYVHGRGVVHRDLKPDNIVIDGDGAPILVDFGLASMAIHEQSREVLDVAGRALGTPAYMAPEQIRGDIVDARADLYALGCILYECIVGQPPFSGSAVKVLNRHLYEIPRPPGEQVRGVPRLVDELVMSLLCKRAEQRIGYAEDVARRLEEVTQTATRRRGPAPGTYLYRPTLAGRNDALSRLEAAIEPTPWHEGAFALIAGRSGMGKTRLATELANRASRSGVRVVTGRGSESTEPGVRGAPLSLLSELLLAIADRCEAHPGLADALLGDERGLLASFEPRFGDDGRIARSEIKRPQLFEGLARVVARMAEQQALFLVLDDLHGADELSVAFLDYLRPEYFVKTPIRIVGTYRSEEDAPWLLPLRHANHVTCVELDELGESAVADMVAGMLALQSPPQAFVHYLVRATEGIPFFVAEYLRAAVEAQVLWRSSQGRWMVGPEGFSTDALARSLPMPGGLLDLVSRRFEQLSSPAQTVVRLAAVAGRQVSERTLREVAEVRAAEVTADRVWRSAVEELRARAVLEDTSRGELHFCHDKLREVIYDGLDVAERRALHLEVALSVERGLVEEAQPERKFVELVRHFGAAERHDKTMVYLEKAGLYAMRTAAFDDACRHFARLLEMAEAHVLGGPTTAQRVTWERRLGEAHYNLGQLAAAERHLELCLHFARQGGRLEHLSTDAKEVVRQLGRCGGVVPRRHVDREELAIDCDAANAAERLCQVYFFQNQRTRAFLTSLRCLQHAERWGPSPELARSYASISLAMGFVPAPMLVERYATLAERVAKSDGDISARAYVSFLRGLYRHGDGQPRSAQVYLEAAVRDARLAGDTRAVQEAMTVLANAHVQVGHLAQAEALNREVLALADRTGNRQGFVWARSGLALNDLHQGDFETALEAFDEVTERLADDFDATQQLAAGLRAVVLLRLGREDRALEVAEETVRLGRGVPPAAFHCLQGYEGSLEVVLTQFEATRASDVRHRIAPLVDEALRQLGRYCRTFAFGRPSLYTYRGWWCRLRGQAWRARTWAARGVDFALERGLVGKAARAQIESTRAQPMGSDDRRHQAARAVELCDRAGLGYWGAVARELARR